MSKLNVLFFVFVMFLIVLASCEEDDDALTVDQSDIVGTWEVVGGDDFTECQNGDNKLFVISLTEIREGQTDNSGCQVNNSYVTLAYEYTNGNSLDAGIGVYKITSFEENRMTFVISSVLATGVTSTVELVKK